MNNTIETLLWEEYSYDCQQSKMVKGDITRAYAKVMAV